MVSRTSCTPPSTSLADTRRLPYSVCGEQDPEQLLKKYKIEIGDLRRELAMHDSLASRSRIAYEPYSDQQRVALTEELMAFLTAGEHDGKEINLEKMLQECHRTWVGMQAVDTHPGRPPIP